MIEDVLEVLKKLEQEEGVKWDSYTYYTLIYPQGNAEMLDEAIYGNAKDRFCARCNYLQLFGFSSQKSWTRQTGGPIVDMDGRGRSFSINH